MTNKEKCNGLDMKYFVLNPTKDDKYGEASREAIFSYAEYIEAENPKLSMDLRIWMGMIIKKLADAKAERD